MSKEINERFIEIFEGLEKSGVIKSRLEAATNLGYKPQAFSEILKLRTNVSTELLQKFCRYYKQDPIYILMGDNFQFYVDKMPSNDLVVDILKTKDDKMLEMARKIFELEHQVEKLKKDNHRTPYDIAAEP
jgi:hypothetical protein